MDTSTLSSTDIASGDLKPLPSLSSTLIHDVPRPAAEWFTRLISPLTDRSASSADLAELVETPASTSSIPLIESFRNLRPVRFLQDSGERVGAMDTEAAGKMVTLSEDEQMPTILLIMIPIMVVILAVLLGMVCFLVAILFLRRKKGIRLPEDGGPLDLSQGDGVMGEGGVDGVESRWLETVEPDVRAAYLRAKDWQATYPPTSIPTDITLSQFLTIQEKGVSAWAFEPDYEDNLSLYVQSRTEITFMADGPGMAPREGGGNSVMANLPLPKVNEVYYWEVKLFEKPPATEVAIGLATKPYPSFRLPGWNRFSVAYFASDGFKSHNYPFTATSYGPPLNEGDVLGVGYRPRTGTVFFTKNGRKLDDCYTGLQKLNLFPTVGANGPCSLQVNLGQAGFLFIEANVKKWGLAPMVGTLAPPPAYGSERGSILLDAGYGTPGAGSHGGTGMSALLEAARARAGTHGPLSSSYASSSHSFSPRAAALGDSPSRSSNSSRRHRRAGRAANLAGSVPAVPSPLRASEAGPGPRTAGSRRRALGRGGRDGADNEDGEPTPAGTGYISPTDRPTVAPRVPDAGALEYIDTDVDSEAGSEGYASSGLTSPVQEPNPPTPNLLDISLHSLRRVPFFGGRETLDVRDPRNREQDEDDEEDEEPGSGGSDETARPGRPARPMIGTRNQSLGGYAQGDSPPPPGYAPLDPVRYADGLPADLPDELINRAIAEMSAAAGEDGPEGHPSATGSSQEESGGIRAWLGLGGRRG